MNFALINRSNEDIDKFRQASEITLKGENIPNPIQTFEEGNFPPYVMEGIRKQGYTHPTAIQAQGWPIALSGRDLVAIAQTGSGKTLGVSLNNNINVIKFFFVLNYHIISVYFAGDCPYYSSTPFESWRWSNSINSRTNS